jgi:hypothetical protein
MVPGLFPGHRQNKPGTFSPIPQNVMKAPGFPARRQKINPVPFQKINPVPFYSPWVHCPLHRRNPLLSRFAFNRFQEIEISIRVDR